MTAPDPTAPPPAGGPGPQAEPLSAEELRAGLDEAAAAVALARQAVATGVHVDLGGLDRRVDQLCGAIGSLAPAEARALEPVLADLIAALDALAADLRGQNATDTPDGAETADVPAPDPDAAAEAAARARARAAYRRDR